MVQLAEQIAVLDGLGAIRPGYADGRTGAKRAAVDQYGRAILPGVISRKNVIDAGEGANYMGGSSYAAGVPLMPSTIGLADLPGTLPTRMNVINPGGGALYSGGASYAPGVPLLSSTVGLAATIGAAGGTAADQDLAGAFNSLGAIRPGYADGRTGAGRARIDEYSAAMMPGVIGRSHVLDASDGANYSGGANYAPGLPLLPSTVGLAGLDRLADGRWLGKARGALGQKALLNARRQVAAGVSMLRAAHPTQKPAVAKALKQAVMKLREVRSMRAKQVTRAIRGGVPVTTSIPYSPSLGAVTVMRGGVPVTMQNPYSPALGAMTVMRGGVPVTMQTPYSPALAMWK